MVEHACPNMPSEEIVPPTMLSEVEARQYVRNNTPLGPGVTLPEGWVTNIINGGAASQLAGSHGLHRNVSVGYVVGGATRPQALRLGSVL